MHSETVVSSNKTLRQYRPTRSKGDSSMKSAIRADGLLRDRRRVGGIRVVGIGALATSMVATTIVASGVGVASASARHAKRHVKKVAVVKIGAPNPLTGAWAENGQNDVNGMKLAAQMINAAGGVKALGGAKVKIITADTSSDNPAQSQAVTEKLVTSDHVSALIGSYASAMTLTSSRAAEVEHVPMITESTVDALTESGNKYIFQLPPLISATEVESLRDYVKLFKAEGHPLHSIASIAVQSTIASTVEKQFKATAAQLGIKVPIYTTFPPGLTDATPLAIEVKNAHPDAVQIGASLNDAVVLVKAIRALGLKVPIIDAIDQSGFGAALGKMANGVLASTFWSDTMRLPGKQGKLLRQERAAYVKKYHVANEPAEAGESFTAVYDIVAAMNRAKSANPQKISNMLHYMSFGPNSGYAAMMPPSGHVNFDKNGLNTYARPVILQWQNGYTPIVWPKEIAAKKPIGIK